jgi:hypothetical protein
MNRAPLITMLLPAVAIMLYDIVDLRNRTIRLFLQQVDSLEKSTSLPHNIVRNSYDARNLMLLFR